MSGIRFCESTDDLARALRDAVPRPTAVVGVGNPLTGDDGFGPAVVAALRPSERITPFDVRGVPESFLGPIAASGCPGILFADAADLETDPGRLAVVDADRLAEIDVSTHVVSLALMAEAVRRMAGEGGAAGEVICALLAVQPESLAGADRLSAPVSAAVRRAARALDAFAAAP
ncbi:MAG: hydrogenase maturation protease [Phycisphaerae bacterium]